MKIHKERNAIILCHILQLCYLPLQNAFMVYVPVYLKIYCSRVLYTASKKGINTKPSTFGHSKVEESPPAYLHSIFEISSVRRMFFNFKISRLKN